MTSKDVTNEELLGLEHEHKVHKEVGGRKWELAWKKKEAPSTVEYLPAAFVDLNQFLKMFKEMDLGVVIVNCPLNRI